MSKPEKIAFQITVFSYVNLGMNLPNFQVIFAVIRKEIVLGKRVTDLGCLSEILVFRTLLKLIIRL